MSRYFRYSLGRLRRYILDAIFINLPNVRFIPFRFYFHQSTVSTRNIFSDAHQTFIGGGLEKFQGGIKEEKYFLSQNNELILKMREQGAKLKCEKSQQSDSEFSEAAEKKSSDYLAFRETSSPNKHKNFQEEAFFLHEVSAAVFKFSIIPVDGS